MSITRPSSLLALAMLASCSRTTVVVQHSTDAREMSMAQLVMAMPDERVELRDGRWIPKAVPAEFEKRGGFDAMKDADWRELLIDGGVIHTRNRWLEGAPFAISVRKTRWLEWSTLRIAAVEPALGEIFVDDSEPSWCGTCRSWELDRMHALEFGDQRTPKIRRVALEVAIDDKWKSRFDVPVESTRDLETIMKADASDDVSRAIRSSMCAFWWNSSEPNSRAVIRVDLQADSERTPALNQLACSVSIELLHSGAVVSRGKFVVDDDDFEPPKHAFVGSSALEPLPSDLATNSDLAGWDVRVTGTPDGVLSIWSAERWWSGTFTAPLAELMRDR